MSPVEWSPCRPRTIQLPLTASPCSRLSRPQSTISQSDFHPVIRPFSPLRLGRSYRLAPEPDGSPLFTLLPLVACWRYRTPGAPQTARVVAACDSAFPFERQGRLLRSRSISGLYSRSLHSGLQPPCLRFATAVTGRHARLGSRLLARLCRGRHRRRQTSTRLQGATLISRVEGWRAGVARSPDPHHVSSPLHVARNVRISRIARPHLLHAKAYGTYPAGATFGPSRRTR